MRNAFAILVLMLASPIMLFSDEPVKSKIELSKELQFIWHLNYWTGRSNTFGINIICQGRNISCKIPIELSMNDMNYNIRPDETALEYSNKNLLLAYDVNRLSEIISVKLNNMAGEKISPIYTIIKHNNGVKRCILMLNAESLTEGKYCLDITLDETKLDIPYKSISKSGYKKYFYVCCQTNNDFEIRTTAFIQEAYAAYLSNENMCERLYVAIDNKWLYGDAIYDMLAFSMLYLGDSFTQGIMNDDDKTNAVVYAVLNYARYKDRIFSNTLTYICDHSLAEHAIANEQNISQKVNELQKKFDKNFPGIRTCNECHQPIDIDIDKSIKKLFDALRGYVNEK